MPLPFLDVIEKKLLLRAALAGYVLSLPLEFLAPVRTAGGLAYLPEIFFIAVVAAFLFQVPGLWHDRNLVWQERHWLDLLAMLYWAAVCGSWLMAAAGHGLREMVGASYMVGLYFIVRFGFSRRVFSFNNACNLFLAAGLVAAAAGIATYLYARFGGETGFAKVHKAYPLTGDTIRSNGFIRNAIFQADFLCCAGLLFLGLSPTGFGKGRGHGWAFFGLAMVALVLTKTKSILIFFGIACWVVAVRGNFPRLRPLLVFAGCFGIAAYFVLSHFLLVDMWQPGIDGLMREDYYFADRLWFVTDRWAVVPTFYFGTKRAALLAFLDHPFFGVGGDCLAGYTTGLVEAGRHFRGFCCAPHSTFFGALGELGLLGFGAVVVLFWKMWRIASGAGGVLKPVALFFLLEGLTVDLMNVRHFWLLLAVLASIQFLEKKGRLPVEGGG